MKTRIEKLFPLALYFLLSFPLFYFVYKFGNPEPLAHDFFQYYRLYKGFDVGNVIAPHNMRLVGSFFVYLLYKMNLFYDTETAFDVYKSWGFLKQVYFDAVFFNWICVVCTCVVIFNVLRRIGVSYLLAFSGGLLHILGFGTIFYQLMPLIEACSILLFALFLSAYLKKSYWALVPLIVLIFQRELLILFIVLIAIIDSRRWNGPFYFRVAVTGVLCFVLHCVLRKTVFYTSALDFQMDPAFLVKKLMHPEVSWAIYIRQFLLGLNIVLIYFAVLIYKRFSGMAIDSLGLIKILAVLLFVHLISIMAALGNNAGRYFYLVIPLVIIQLIVEAAPLVANERQSEGINRENT